MLKQILNNHTSQPLHSTLNDPAKRGLPNRMGKLEGIGEEHHGQLNKIRGEQIDQL